MSQPGFGAIPGASQRQLNQVAAIRAACQATGPERDFDSVEIFADQFIRWLKDSNDETDGEVRRQILLSVTADAGAAPERGVARAKKLVKLTDDLYRRVK